MWKRGESRLKWMVPAGIFFPFGYGQQDRKNLEKASSWDSLIPSCSVSARVIFPVHIHETQQWTPKAQNKIRAIYVPPHQSGRFKNCFLSAGMCSVVSVTPFFLTVNSKLTMWERLKPKHGASSVLPQAGRLWCLMVLSLWSLLWVWEQQLWEKTAPILEQTRHPTVWINTLAILGASWTALLRCKCWVVAWS